MYSKHCSLDWQAVCYLNADAGCQEDCAGWLVSEPLQRAFAMLSCAKGLSFRSCFDLNGSTDCLSLARSGLWVSRLDEKLRHRRWY